VVCGEPPFGNSLVRNPSFLRHALLLFIFIFTKALHSITLLLFLLSVLDLDVVLSQKSLFRTTTTRGEQMLFGVAFSSFLMKIEFEPGRNGHVKKRANLCKRSDGAVCGKQHP